MIKQLFFITSLGLTLLLASCANNTQEGKKINEGKKDLIEVRVTKAMGTALSDTIKYLPLIGSLAEAKLKDEARFPYLVIGKDIAQDDNLSVQKVARLVYSHHGIEKKLILAFPSDAKFQSLEVGSFNDFATDYISIKWQLENWYNHFGGIGNSKFIKWELL